MPLSYAAITVSGSAVSPRHNGLTGTRLSPSNRRSGRLGRTLRTRRLYGRIAGRRCEQATVVWEPRFAGKRGPGGPRNSDRFEFLFEHLLLAQLGIIAACGEQFRVRSSFDDAPMIQDNNL